jgi:hypothetical protein
MSMGVVLSAVHVGAPVDQRHYGVAVALSRREQCGGQPPVRAHQVGVPERLGLFVQVHLVVVGGPARLGLGCAFRRRTGGVPGPLVRLGWRLPRPDGGDPLPPGTLLLVVLPTALGHVQHAGRDRRIRPAGQQHLDGLRPAGHGREHQRRLPPYGLGGIRIRAMLDQRPGRISHSGARREVQGGSSGRGGCPRVRTRLEQRDHRLLPPLRRRHVQGSVTPDPRAGIQVRPGLDDQP